MEIDKLIEKLVALNAPHSEHDTDFILYGLYNLTVELAEHIQKIEKVNENKRRNKT